MTPVCQIFISLYQNFTRSLTCLYQNFTRSLTCWYNLGMPKSECRQHNDQPQGWLLKSSVFCMFSSWTRENSFNTAINLLKAVSRVFPAHVDWSGTQTYKWKKDESVVDFKDWLEALFVWHSGFYTIKKANYHDLAVLFLNELSLEISGLIKRQK